MKTSLGLVLLVIGLLVGSGIGYAVAPSLSPSGSQTTALTGTVTLGELADLTGSFQAQGTQQKLAGDLAITDINSWLTSIGSPVRFQFKVTDDGGDPTKTLQNLQSLTAQGVKIFVGPTSSGEASNILSYAQSNNLVLVSATSSSPSLDKRTAGTLYRMIIPDDLLGTGQASLISSQGYKGVIIVYRDDSWGSPVAQEFASAWKAIGGTVVDTISFPTITTGTYDFTAQLSKMDSDFKSAVSQFGQGKVAIEVFSFDEVGTMVAQAQTSYPDLLGTKWFSSDGAVFSSDIISTAGASGAQVTLMSTSPVATNSSLYQSVASRLAAAAGQPANQYAIFNYDATWVTALAVLSCNKYDASCVSKSIPTVASTFFGATGWCHLNAAGDRNLVSEGIFQISTKNGSQQWAQVGVWDSASNTLTMFPSSS